MSDSLAYRSAFGNWEQRASVRTGPRRTIDSNEKVIYFPPELVPISSHPLVTAREDGTEIRLLTRRLYQYLHFTSELEALAVMPVAQLISRGVAGIDLPGNMREDAFKIVTDEAWHAQFSYDLLRQVESQSGLAAGEIGDPSFLTRLKKIGGRMDPSLRGLQDLLFCVVSETLISAILTNLPQDDRLPDGVRELVQDHALDEGKHHAYFRDFLKYFWHALSTSERRAIGPFVPELVYAFLEPDYAMFEQGLLAEGFTPEEARQIVTESYPRATVRADVAQAGRPVTRYLTELGAMDDSRTHAAFTEHKLLIG
ncbi:diiron oxygenase [Spongiactinospora rosea]|nr:diiron oxygenase [Spongiactinospora rosea]